MDTSSEVDLKRILRLAYKKKILFLATAAAVTAAIMIGGYLSPKKYQAKSVIFIERNVLNELIKDVTVTPSIEEKIKALSVVMKSRSLILKVMSDLEFDMVNKSSAQLESAIANFQEKTEISVEMNKATRRDMDLFTVSFTGSDPKFASTFVNTLVRRYIEENLSMKREEAYGASRFLLDQLSAFKVKLDKIESSITRQRKEKNVSQKSLALYEQLQPLLRRKNELLVQYTENHPAVARIKAEIETLEQQMRNASTAAGPDSALVDLERERDTTKKIYEDLLATLRRSEVSTQLEVQDKAGAFRILDPAIVPTRPLSPNMVKVIMLALLSGLGGGLGLIILIDKADNSVKSVETLRKLGLPILAVISTIRTEQETAAIKKKDRAVYSVAGIYIGAVLLLAAMEIMGLTYVNDFVQGTKAGIGNTVKKIWQKS